jgi:hypothetical protein
MKLIAVVNARNLVRAALRAHNTVGPAKLLQVGTALVLVTEPLDQLYKVHVLHGEPSMPRRKRKADELTTEEAMRRLFPKKLRDEAKRIALESRKKSTKKDST